MVPVAALHDSSLHHHTARDVYAYVAPIQRLNIDVPFLAASLPLSYGVNENVEMR